MAILAVATLPMRSGTPEDVVTNSFVFGGADGTIDSGDFNDVRNFVKNFYNAVPTGWSAGQTVASLISPAVDRTGSACGIKYYDISGHLDGSPHGSPFFAENFTLGAAGSSAALPEECAICVTIEAVDRENQLVERPDGDDPGTKVDRPRQRYTGRLYIGPCHQGTTTTDANGMSLIADNPRFIIQDSLKVQADALNTAEPAIFYGVWSRADAAVREVSHLVTDNAWDTQRRRGRRFTARNRTARGALGAPQLELAS